jgi:hypothetical protein
VRVGAEHARPSLLNHAARLRPAVVTSTNSHGPSHQPSASSPVSVVEASIRPGALVSGAEVFQPEAVVPAALVDGSAGPVQEPYRSVQAVAGWAAASFADHLLRAAEQFSTSLPPAAALPALRLGPARVH